ncbi:DUF1566 domain-containing protein [Xylella fastidiosa]|uniref:DUF1566 domain-containing protein n=1 Tax=Xylella fastidiosa subsp. fastidiosa TaxID=644356 RepID=A0AAJ5R1Y0_XYLFS|nr:DUF1566 domain-containing protein [Xylella fastidiosa]WCF29084.1 DUF1566 domain-containing protein [Xylella fastidiosa subsp. fastidiosa]
MNAVNSNRFTPITDANGKHIITRDNCMKLEWTVEPIGLFTNAPNDSNAAIACCVLRIGSYRNWRLPELDELESIRTVRQCMPAIDVDAFPGIKGGKFWTATPCYVSSNNSAWVVDFDYGEIVLEPYYALYQVLAVRDLKVNNVSGLLGKAD